MRQKTPQAPAPNAGQGGGCRTSFQNNLFVLTAGTPRRWHHRPSWSAGLCLDRPPVLKGVAECPLWKLTVPMSPLPLAPQCLQGAEWGGGAAREQAPRTTAPRHVRLTLPHPKLRPLLAWHCVWREARHLPPAPPPPRGPRGPCGGGVGLRELPRTPPPQVCRPDVLLAYPVFLDHEKTNCGRICRVASVCASWGDCV